MMPNEREILEAVDYIKDTVVYLDWVEDSEAIENLLMALTYLTGHEVSYEELLERAEEEEDEDTHL